MNAALSLHVDGTPTIAQADATDQHDADVGVGHKWRRRECRLAAGWVAGWSERRVCRRMIRYKNDFLVNKPIKL